MLKAGIQLTTPCETVRNGMQACDQVDELCLIDGYYPRA